MKVQPSVKQLYHYLHSLKAFVSAMSGCRPLLCEELHWNFDGDFTDSIDCFWPTGHFTKVILPIYKYSVLSETLMSLPPRPKGIIEERVERLTAENEELQKICRKRKAIKDGKEAGCKLDSSSRREIRKGNGV